MDKIYLKNSNIVTRVVAGETILVPISGNVANMQHIFSLNPVAEFIWENLDGKADVEQIVTGIVDKFEIDSDNAENDCLEFLGRLIESELVSEKV